MTKKEKFWKLVGWVAVIYYLTFLLQGLAAGVGASGSPYLVADGLLLTYLVYKAI